MVSENKNPLKDRRVRLIRTMESEFSDLHIPCGTEGVIVECYGSPPQDGYAVDVCIVHDPAKGLELGNVTYDNLMLRREDFELLEE